MNWKQLTCDNEQRFSLGGVGHELPQRDTRCGDRAGKRKTYWTKPRPPAVRLWALNDF